MTAREVGIVRDAALGDTQGLGGLLAQPPSTPVGNQADGRVAPLRRWGIWNAELGRWLTQSFGRYLTEDLRVFYFEYEARAVATHDCGKGWAVREMAR